MYKLIIQKQNTGNVPVRDVETLVSKLGEPTPETEAVQHQLMVLANNQPQGFRTVAELELDDLDVRTIVNAALKNQ